MTDPPPAPPALASAPVVGFGALGLSPQSLSAVASAGFAEPTQIQALAIPPALAGRDVVGQARTGTGKTAAFALPILDRLGPRGPVQGLVITPTRELALQVAGEFQRFGHARGARVAAVYGGQPLGPQATQLHRGAEVVVGTPGRLLDHLRRRTLSLADLRALVLDECDRMLDLGFREDIDDIVRRTPATRQTMLFSATIPPEVVRLAARYLRDPARIFTAPEKLTVDEVEQSYVSVSSERKLPLLLELLRREQPPLTLVFARTRAAVKKLAPRLSHAGVDAREIHGDLDQNQRERVMEAFRRGEFRVLVATDVASRGLDISGISHIVNYDLPDDPEDYVHRIGRTARMGAAGRAIAFVTREQGPLLTEIEKLINHMIREESLEGFEAGDGIGLPEAPKLPPAPIGWRHVAAKRRGRRRRR
ncbi:MAG: DEAD/DEAH box helicase [Planctomycetales bacterium]|nr:DEAD/DEAH box helicase [Planctomycetales bacterium]